MVVTLEEGSPNYVNNHKPHLQLEDPAILSTEVTNHNAGGTIRSLTAIYMYGPPSNKVWFLSQISKGNLKRV